MALLLVTPFAAGCKKYSVAAEQSQAAAAQPAKPVPEALPDVIARVNGEEVTKKDLEKVIAQMETNAGGPVPADKRNEVYRGAIDRLVDMRLLAQEVKARGLTPDAQQLDTEMKNIRGRFPSEEEFNKALAAQNMTAEKLKTELGTQTGVRKMMEAEAQSVPPVTDADCKDFYDKNPNEFKQGEQVRASHILFKGGSDEEAKKKTRATAEMVLKEAKSGKDFGELAKQYSTDGSAPKGGDLGFFEKERMVPAFANAAFALQPGQISDIVESEFGLHIIKVTDRKAAETLPLEKVAPQLKQFLTKKRQQEHTQAFLKQLRSKAKIEVLI